MKDYENELPNEPFAQLLTYGLIWLTSMFGALFIITIIFK